MKRLYNSARIGLAATVLLLITAAKPAQAQYSPMLPSSNPPQLLNSTVDYNRTAKYKRGSNAGVGNVVGWSVPVVLFGAYLINCRHRRHQKK
jgi:hypothetical protein